MLSLSEVISFPVMTIFENLGKERSPITMTNMTEFVQTLSLVSTWMGDNVEIRDAVNTIISIKAYKPKSWISNYTATVI